MTECNVELLEKQQETRNCIQQENHYNRIVHAIALTSP